MRILLVNFHANDPSHGMYGLAWLATYIQDVCEVMVVDALRENYYDAVRRFNPDWIGMTAYSHWYREVLDKAIETKKLFPRVKIVLGGPHITSLPRSFWNPPFDCAIIGEGEEALRDLSAGRDPKFIKGVITKHFNNGNDFAQHTDPFNVKKMGVVRLDKYTRVQNYRPGIAGIVTSRGCYFNCQYCSMRSMIKGVRLRPRDIVAEEIRLCYERLGTRFMVFWDDVSLLNMEWTDGLIEELYRRGLLGKIRYEIHARASSMTDERCRQWHRLGVCSLNMGLDFGSDRMLKLVKGPDSSIEKNKEALLMGGRYGFETRCSFIFGGPTETIEEMKETLDLMTWYAIMKEKGLIKGDIWFFVATCLPGTQWWDMALQKGENSKGSATAKAALSKVSWDMDLRRLWLHNWKDHFMLEDNISEEEINWVNEEAKKRMARINGSWYLA